MTGRSPLRGSGSRPTGGAAKASPAKPSIPNAATDKKLYALVAKAVVARAEYMRRYKAMQQIKPYLNDAIRAADEADTALQEYMSELAGRKGA